MQNKLIPILAIVSIGAVVVLFATHNSHAPIAAGAPLASVPTPPVPKVEKGADTDTPADTVRTLTAQVSELKRATQQLADENATLKHDNSDLHNDEARITEKVTEKVTNALRQSNPANSAPVNHDNAKDLVSNTVNAGSNNLQNLTNSITTNASDIPSGLGLNSTQGQAVATPGANLAANQAIVPAAQSHNFVRLVPMGMTEKRGDNGKTDLVSTFTPKAVNQPMADSVNSWLTTGEAPQNNDSNTASSKAIDPKRKKATKPYFTLPENGTLTGVTAMTAIVGRVPVDGHVQDPMEFKLLVGRENLAANGMPVPKDIAGAIVSGTGIGDMTLLCNEGSINSLTFIFNDGTIQTVSQRRGGSAPALSGGASTGAANGNSNGGIAGVTKLGYISDEYGNPCITGKFVTNAPAYLTDVAGLKTLAVATTALATAQTSTVSNGAGLASGVTGNKGSFVLGQAAGGAVDEVSAWIMRRLNSSFDAVVTPAGAHVVIHLDQEIKLDKEPDARNLDYGHINGPGNSSSHGAFHGFD